MNQVDYSSQTDQELTALLKQGDHAAFSEIYKRYSVILYYKVNKMLRDEEAAKDLIQDLFISIWDNPHSINEESNLGGYLYVIARNNVLQLIRKEKVKNDYLASIAQFASEVSMDTLEELDERDLSRILTEEIAKLPTKMKRVFEMSRTQNLSHAEIAKQLGISDQTVKKQVNNALKILRSKLKSYAPLGWIILELLKR